MIEPYSTGKQPCPDFEPQHGGNVHECFGPYSQTAATRCTSRVSFCARCMYDHHFFGWETCGQEDEAMLRYKGALASGLSDYEAREEGWPSDEVKG